MNTVYKIRHKKTGLFYQPNTKGTNKKSTNLHENGKIYENRKPNFKQIYHFVRVSDKIREEYNLETELVRGMNKLAFKEEEFEIVEYKLVEVI